MRRLLFLVAILAGGVLQFSSAPSATAGPTNTQNIASDTYYHFDVDGGVLDVNVEATIQAVRLEASEVYLWTMHDPEDLVIKRDGTELEWTIARDQDYGDASLLRAQLIRPLTVSARADFTMTYRISNLDGNTSLVLPGIIALGLVSQGSGSFVFADLPIHGDNYLDPGCLKVAHQPDDLVADGYERWVCGETAIVALNTDDPKVIRQCENLDDRCRQRIYNWPYAAYAQSTTNDEAVATLVADVEMERGPVEVTLKYFKRDLEWAQKQFDVALAALPFLEDLFGFPYERDSLLMRESYQLYFFGIAGLAFPDQGEVLLVSRTDNDAMVTIHELAHQWAGFNLAEKWLWEGLAGWATTVVAPQIDVPLTPGSWDEFGYEDPLATWYAGSEVYDSEYWYGKSEAFWNAYEDAIGGREEMASVLALSEQGMHGDPVDSRWFMNRGEEAGDVILDDLFLEWVFHPIAAQGTLAQRRDSLELVQALETAASAVGLVGIPPDISVNLEEWYFGPVPGQVQSAQEVVADYEDIQAEAERLGLPAVNSLVDSWATRPISESAARVSEQAVATDAIFNEMARLAREPNDDSQAKIDEAIEAYSAGDFASAKRLAAESVSVAVSDDAAEKVVQYARDVKESFSPNLFEKFGLLGKNPEAHLLAAEEALVAGDSAQALQEAQAAYETWNGAQSRGFLFVGIAGLGMCLFAVGIWWLIRRLEGTPADEKELWERFEIGETDGNDLDDTPEPGAFWRGEADGT